MHFKRQQHDGCNRFSAVRLVTNISKRKWISHWLKPSYKLQMAIKSESHAWITKKPTMIASESFQRFKIPILHSSDFTCLHKSCLSSLVSTFRMNLFCVKMSTLLWKWSSQSKTYLQSNRCHDMDHLLHLQRQKIRDVCSKEKSNLARDNKQEIPVFPWNGKWHNKMTFLPKLKRI